MTSIERSVVRSIYRQLGSGLCGLACILAAVACATVACVADSGLRRPDGVSAVSVEVPFRFEQNKIVVPLSVNGSPPLDFVFDSGASVSVLFASRVDDDLAQDLDLRIIGPAQVIGAGGGGVGGMDTAWDVRLEIGGLRVTGVPLAVLRAELPASELGEQGVVGRDLLDHWVVTLDWQHRHLRFTEPEHFQVPTTAEILPLSYRDGHVFVEAEVNLDGQRGRPVRLVVDSGAFHALALDARGWGSLPTPHLDDALLGRGLAGDIRGGIGRARSLRLGTTVLRDVLIRYPGPDVIEVIAVGSDGNLGAEVLRRFVVTFDYPGRRLLLEPTPAVTEAFAFSTAGFAVRSTFTEEGAARIEDLYADSPATEAGLRRGDEVIRIDGQRPSDLGVDAFRALLQGPPGTVLQLEVQRGTSVRSVELTLRRLL